MIEIDREGRVVQTRERFKCNQDFEEGCSSREIQPQASSEAQLSEEEADVVCLVALGSGAIVPINAKVNNYI